MRRLSQLLATRWHLSYNGLYETGRRTDRQEMDSSELIIHGEQHGIGTIGSKRIGGLATFIWCATRTVLAGNCEPRGKSDACIAYPLELQEAPRS